MAEDDIEWLMLRLDLGALLADKEVPPDSDFHARVTIHTDSRWRDCVRDIRFTANQTPADAKENVTLAWNGKHGEAESARFPAHVVAASVNVQRLTYDQVNVLDDGVKEVFPSRCSWLQALKPHLIGAPAPAPARVIRGGCEWGPTQLC